LSRSLLRSLVAEAIGTFAFAGPGAIKEEFI
jgi:hypothetical protein